MKSGTKAALERLEDDLIGAAFVAVLVTGCVLYMYGIWQVT